MIPYIPQAVMGTVYPEFNRESAQTARFILMATMISPTVNGESSSLAVSKVFHIFLCIYLITVIVGL